VRLDITVDDAAVVGVAQGFGDLNHKMQRFPPAQCAFPLHILFERDAVNELHDDVFQLFGAGYVVYSHDIGMVEHGNRLALGMKAPAEIRVPGVFLF
jgi:hypothetical protein